MSIIATSKETLGKLKVASFNSDCLAINQGIGQLYASRLQYAMESRPRNTHLLRALFLFQPL